MRSFLNILFLVVLGFSKSIASSGLNCTFEKLFINGDMQQWAGLVDSLQHQQLSRADDDILLYAEYGLVAYYIAQNQKKEAEQLLDIFDAHCDLLLDQFPDHPNYNAFKAAGYGFKIGLSPWKAPFLSYYHHQRVNKAMQFRKIEVLPIIEQANSYYFRPSFVGGDKQKALAYYEKANQLLQKETSCNWVYYSNSTWLGQVYTKLNYPDKAKQLYQKLLQFQPDFQFVKNELLPQLERGEFNDIGGRFEKIITE